MLVRIDDTSISSKNTSEQISEWYPIEAALQDLKKKFFRSHEPSTAVYQVTRTGHDNCDVTEGNLLDITPWNVDGQKVVTLYDKDLTEGMNLLIGRLF